MSSSSQLLVELPEVGQVNKRILPDFELLGNQRLDRIVLYLGLAQTINGILLGLVGLGLLFFLGTDYLPVTLIITFFYHLLFYGSSTLLAWRNRVKIARIVLMFSTSLQLVSLTFLAPFSGGTQCLLVWLIILSGLLFNRYWAAMMGLVSIITIVINILVLLVWKLYTPPLNVEGVWSNITLTLCLIITMLLSIVGIYLLITNLHQALIFSVQGRKIVETTNRQLSLQQKYIEKLSEQLAVISAQLATVSSQQASGTLEQVQTINEITTSMAELSNTSLQITASASIIAKETQNTLEIAAAAEQNTARAKEIAEKGHTATSQTIQSINHVYENCSIIFQQLENLSGKSENIGSVIELMNNISTETHLLALNAAIESAGAGEYGNRFGTVAKEVKQLANRSRHSAEEVKKTIAEIIVEINKATRAAQKGLDESEKTIELARETEQIIGQLTEVVENSAKESEIISAAAGQNQQLAEEIQLATRQQLGGSQQIEQALRGVNDISIAVSSSAKQVSGSTTEIKELITNLRKILAGA